KGLIMVTNSLRSNAPGSSLPLLVFSHLRWDFVFQRPQHLMTRYAKTRRVYFIEEPIFEDAIAPHMKTSERAGGVLIAVPALPHGMSYEEINAELKNLVNGLIRDEKIGRFATWYYTPMALSFTDHLKPEVVMYDCMDELSAFRGAPPSLVQNELRLMEMADVVYTGGHSLYEAKKNQHHNIHPFPSSIDRAHFGQARSALKEPSDQSIIPGKRIGFFGVIDERFDIELLREMAILRPDWNFVIIGPVVKIDANDLPRSANIFYLGQKDYQQLPQYLAGWDIAMLPFAKNESTQFISPTKTPEYLAAGRPVISTSIRDVVKPYGDQNLVGIADSAPEFIAIAQSYFDRDSTATG
ncbi:MAG: glycosyltransferase family 1 protein, partial [Proteobacteria bacterium]